MIGERYPADKRGPEAANVDEQLDEIYRRLYAHFGPQHWWPGKSAFEVILGAILTQNTAWTNVERALANLKRARLLHVQRLHKVREQRLAGLIRPSGYYHLKAKKLKAFTRFLFEKHRGRLSHLFRQETGALRDELLAVYGIGPETADSIILYAAKQPIFVVDAYTRRIAARLGLVHAQASYDELQQLFMEHLPRAQPLFNEYHALFVALGKNYCVKNTPRCSACPLQEICQTGVGNARVGNARRSVPYASVPYNACTFCRQLAQPHCLCAHVHVLVMESSHVAPQKMRRNLPQSSECGKLRRAVRSAQAGYPFLS